MAGRFVFVAVALVAGAGVFVALLAFFSLRGETRVLHVSAPDEPVRVRPRESGGTEFPFTDVAVLNSEQVVYERLLPPGEEPLPEALNPVAVNVNVDDNDDTFIVNNDDNGGAFNINDDSDTAAVTGNNDTFIVNNDDDENGGAVIVDSDDNGGAFNVNVDNVDNNAIAVTVTEPIKTDENGGRVAESVETNNAAVTITANTNANSEKWVAQLASLTSHTGAENTRETLRSKYPELQNVSLKIEVAAVNGTTYHRIIAGPWSDDTPALNLCSNVRKKGADCLVRKQ
ncbi:MAG: SPOR domain-containing protein [Alphaproteobacteria bacterium]|nr:SPOR domain-containing protein [Alphaproteobacteria bacterium]